MAIKSRGGAVALGCTGTDGILRCHLQSLASLLSPPPVWLTTWLGTSFADRSPCS